MYLLSVMGFLLKKQRLTLKKGHGEDRHFQMYFAQVYQKTIGCCILSIEDNKALLLWDAVLPMYRRQGVGSMMVLERLKIAKEQGCDHAYALGSYAHLATLRTLGFKPFANFNLVRFDQDNTMDEVNG